MAGKWLPLLPFNKYDYKIFFYAGITLLTIVSILALFSYSFAGSPSPLDLIHYGNLKFSYTGTPSTGYIFSNNFNTGLSGVNGTETNLTLKEGATLTFYPAGDIRVFTQNDTRLIKNGNEYQIRIGPGEEARVYITIAKEDGFNYNMRFKFNDSNNMTVPGSDTHQNVTWITRKSGDEYVVNAIYLPGANASFTVINTVKERLTAEPRWTFPVRVNLYRCGVDGQPIWGDCLTSYAYNGTITVQTDGQFWLRSPISKFSSLYCDRVRLENADGDLDVQHNGHKSTSADTITAERGSDFIKASLLGGRISAGGTAERLNFRDKAFEHPLMVIIKEGNFAILTGLLSSFLTIMLARLIMTIKRK